MRKQKSSLVIELPYGGEFNANDLVAHVRSTGIEYIIQGQRAATREAHNKKTSLDYWLRQYAKRPDYKQASNAVIDELVGTGLFEFSRNLICPETGRKCRGIVLRKEG